MKSFFFVLFFCAITIMIHNYLHSCQFFVFHMKHQPQYQWMKPNKKKRMTFMKIILIIIIIIIKKKKIRQIKAIEFFNFLFLKNSGSLLQWHDKSRLLHFKHRHVNLFRSEGFRETEVFLAAILRVEFRHRKQKTLLFTCIIFLCKQNLLKTKGSAFHLDAGPTNPYLQPSMQKKIP